MTAHDRNPVRGPIGAALAIFLTLATVSCGDSSTEPDPLLGAIADYLTGASVAGTTVSAQIVSGSPPANGGGPSVGAPAIEGAVTGGSTLIPLTASGPFQTVALSVPGIDSYYQISLPAEVTSVTLVITLAGAEGFPDLTFDFVYAVAAADGIFGPSSATSVTVTPGLGGDIQVNVSWNTIADVDLHVVEPGGEEIYYSNTTSASGGVLDIDANAGCSLDNVFAENIGWPTNTAPSGQYTVRVAYWSACGVTQTDYVVTVTRGSIIETFSGSFTGAGTGGGSGAGIDITSFTF